MDEPSWGSRVVDLLFPGMTDTFQKDQLIARVDKLLSPITSEDEGDELRQARENHHNAFLKVHEAKERLRQCEKYLRACITRLKNLGEDPVDFESNDLDNAG